ncbi:MAG: hypothetical protein ACLTMP_05385 [Eggerthella lenta]
MRPHVGQPRHRRRHRLVPPTPPPTNIAKAAEKAKKAFADAR